MNTALSMGAEATVEQKRAPRLQSEGPHVFTLPGATPGYSTSIALARSGQEQNRKRVAFGADGSTLLRNPGQLRKTLKALGRLVRGEYGPQGCADPHAAQALFLAYAAIEDAAAAGDDRYKRTLDGWARRRLPGLSRRAQAEALAELRTHPVELTTRFLGDLLGVTDKQRSDFKLWLAEVDHPSAEDAAEKKHERDAAYARAYRERRGATPRSRCTARKRDQQPDLPKSTLYDRERASRHA